MNEIEITVKASDAPALEKLLRMIRENNRIYSRQYYARNRDKFRRAARKWRENHPDAYRASHKKYNDKRRKLSQS